MLKSRRLKSDNGGQEGAEQTARDGDLVASAGLGRSVTAHRVRRTVVVVDERADEAVMLPLMLPDIEAEREPLDIDDGIEFDDRAEAMTAEAEAVTDESEARAELERQRRRSDGPTHDEISAATEVAEATTPAVPVTAAHCQVSKRARARRT